LGTVYPLKDGQTLQVGKTYGIRARPGIDSIFNGWTGTIVTNKTTFSFVMVEGMNLTATFVPNPFAETRGTYMGLIQSTIPDHEQSGFVKITTTRSGTFSGRVTLGAKLYSVNGRFNGDGSWTGGRTHTDLVLDLLLHLDDNSDQITGSISDGTFTSTLSADRMVYNARDNPAPEAGKYTLLIPTNPTEPDSPQGNGFGILTVSTAGKTRVAGSLADGTKFSQAAGISKTGVWPFYVSTLRRSGSISGPITFRDQTDVSDLDGTVNWFRAPNPRAKIFADGFTTQTTLLGSTYFRPTGEPVLTVPPVEQNVVVNFGEGDLDSELQKPATLELNNRLVVPDSNDEKLRLSITSSSGAFRGSFVHPVTGRRTFHSGVVFQKQNLAEGYFLGTEQSGFVSVVPTDSETVLTTNEPPVIEESPDPEPIIPIEPISPPRKKKAH
jgi:hypothetical protein